MIGALIASLLATGSPVAAVREAAAATSADAPVGVAVALGRGSLPAVIRESDGNPARDVAWAMRVLGPREPGHRHPSRSSRSRERKPLHRWVRPNYGPLTSPFGYRWGRLHAGIDIAGPYGSPILAATDGCISYAGPMSGYGEVLKITDWDGTETVYGHMSSFVRTSGCVKAGTVIARVGAAGDATGPHLHFEIHVGGQPVNPIPFLARHGLVL
jgi:murein DD-endopeptidase MepM/ murein hydrolase activator NlpD